MFVTEGVVPCACAYTQTDEQGFDFLDGLLTDGLSIDAGGGSHTPAYSLNAQQIALACTVALHPHFTTRAKAASDLDASIKAMVLLEDALCILGPTNAVLAAALVFGSSKTKRRVRKRKSTDPALSDDDDVEQSLTRSVFAHDKSLFNEIENVWQLIGWAFNCSVKHTKRWEVWSPWLKWFFRLVESDWTERTHASEVQASADPLLDSIALKLLQGSNDRNVFRRMLRAIFADGQVKALQEFTEVFPDELKELKKKDPLQEERKELNLDEGLYGDYDDNDDEDELEDDADSSQEPAAAEIETKTDSLGGVESIKLRIQLLRLVSRVGIATSLVIVHN